MDRPLIVLDTMVAVGSILGKPDGADALVVDAIETGEVGLVTSDAWLSELVRVLGYPEIEARVAKKPGGVSRAVRAASNLTLMGELRRPRRLHWPNLLDPKDSWVLDLALDARPDYVVTRDRRVREAAERSGFGVRNPPEFLGELR